VVSVGRWTVKGSPVYYPRARTRRTSVAVKRLDKWVSSFVEPCAGLSYHSVGWVSNGVNVFTSRIVALDAGHADAGAIRC